MLGLLFAGFLCCCGVAVVAWAVITPPKPRARTWNEDDIVWCEELDNQLGVVVPFRNHWQ